MSEQQKQWDHSVDILVVGSGAGGMTAACRAKDTGANPLIIEKSDKYGGSSAMSGGVIWIPNNHLMPPTGIKDQDEDGFRYLKSLIGDEVPEERIWAYVQNGRKMLRYVEDFTYLRFEALDVYPDYYPDKPGYKSGSRSLDPKAFDGKQLGKEFENLRDQHIQVLIFGRLAMTTMEVRAMFKQAKGWVGLLMKSFFGYWLDIPQRLKNKRSRRLTFGNALIGALRKTLMDKEVPIWLEYGLKELVVEGDRVVGVIAEHQGREMRIEATKGVILAAGGFEANQQMREEHLPGPTKAEWTAANPANTGEVIKAGQAIGADVAFMDDAWWGPTCRVPGEEQARMLVIEKSLPGGMFVGKSGQRFTNEAAAYIEIVKDMHKAKQQGADVIPAWFVFGKHYRSKYPIGPILPSSNVPEVLSESILHKDLYDKFIFKAETVEELAGKIGVDAAGLQETIDKMNEAARIGKDTDFNRGDSEYDRYYGDDAIEPNPCLGPIEAPFYAVEVYPGELGTKGGLKANENAQVLNTSGEVIQGLYAVGNCSGALMGPTYAGAGSTIGPSMTFAYVAVNDMMGIVEKDAPKPIKAKENKKHKDGYKTPEQIQKELEEKEAKIREREEKLKAMKEADEKLKAEQEAARLKAIEVAKQREEVEKKQHEEYQAQIAEQQQEIEKEKAEIRKKQKKIVREKKD